MNRQANPCCLMQAVESNYYSIVAFIAVTTSGIFSLASCYFFNPARPTRTWTIEINSDLNAQLLFVFHGQLVFMATPG